MSTALKIAIFVCSLIGLVSASHLATILVRERFIRAVDMTKIGTVSAFAIGLSAFVYPVSSIFDVWLRVFMPPVTALASAFLLAKRRQARVENDLPKWLGNLIMRMRMGRSLEASLEEELSKNHSSTRFHMLAIARVVSFSPQNDSIPSSRDSLVSLPPKIRSIAEELRRINLLPSRQIEELERWRSRIRDSETFRRKSNQAMAQTRAQALVLGLIYVALAGFAVAAFGWATVRGSMRVSVPLFITGVFWIWRGGGRVKWTV